VISQLKRFLRWIFPQKVYFVYNREDHVGTFFQAAFYSREGAEAYIKKVVQEEIASHAETKKVLTAAGMWDPSYDGVDMLSRTESTLFIEEGKISE